MEPKLLYRKRRSQRKVLLFFYESKYFSTVTSASIQILSRSKSGIAKEYSEKCQLWKPPNILSFSSMKRSLKLFASGRGNFTLNNTLDFFVSLVRFSFDQKSLKNCLHGNLTSSYGIKLLFGQLIYILFYVGIRTHCISVKLLYTAYTSSLRVLCCAKLF